MKFKNKLLGMGVSIALSIGILTPQKAEAVCVVKPTQIVETMFEMCWTCVFP
ncbi:TPA: conjugal transfer protein TraU, partial [Campylobacter coli]|nr:conjugal transfer protein TraU [Campylobacter coli]